jgi:hypothetical protein
MREVTLGEDTEDDFYTFTMDELDRILELKDMNSYSLGDKVREEGYLHPTAFYCIMFDESHEMTLSELTDKMSNDL